MARLIFKHEKVRHQTPGIHFDITSGQPVEATVTVCAKRKMWQVGLRFWIFSWKSLHIAFSFNFNTHG